MAHELTCYAVELTQEDNRNAGAIPRVRPLVRTPIGRHGRAGRDGTAERVARARSVPRPFRDLPLRRHRGAATSPHACTYRCPP